MSAQSPTDEIKLLRFPTVHGDTVVFTYAGDLWTSSLSGGIARRLTSHPGSESYARYSPDGKWIAFTGSYDGNGDVFVIPAEGGEPKRLTYRDEPDIVVGWTPDGKVAFRTAGAAFTDRYTPLYTIDPEGGLPKPTPLVEFDSGTFSPDGSTVVYNRMGAHAFNWRRYRGGTQGFISFYNLKTNEYSELPHGRENSWHPLWVGKDVYYVSDKNLGTVNLYRYDTVTKKTEQVTQYNDADIRYPNTDGKTIVFERGGILSAYDIATKSVRSVQPRIIGDKLTTRPQLRKLANWLQGGSLSPSGNRLMLNARGRVFSVPAKNGDTRLMLEVPGTRQKDVQWSPDGQTISYLSDESGEYQIYTMPQRGGKATQLTKNLDFKIDSYQWAPDGKKLSITSMGKSLYYLDVPTQKITKVFDSRVSYIGAQVYDWSPCSGWIAYVNALPNLQGALFLYNLKSGKTTQVTDGFFGDSSVSFDLNGKYLYLSSSRSFNPKPGAFEFQANFENPDRVYLITLTKDLTNPLLPPSDEEPEKPKETPKQESKDKPAEPGKDAKPADAKDKPADQAKDAQEKPADAAKDAKQDKPKEAEAKETKIDLEGMADRLIPLPWPDGDYPVVIGGTNSVFTLAGGRLLQFDLGSRQSNEILSGFQGLAFNQNRTKLAYFAGQIVGIADVRPGIAPGTGRVNLDAVEAVIDPREEWRQVFNEAWRYMRDRFYDPSFTGVDWNAMKVRYEAMLPYVASRNDLNYVLGLLIGELGTGHAYVGGGDTGGAPGVPVGSLGAEYEPKGGNLVFSKIYRGYGFEASSRGPLTDVGMNVKVGDYLLEIDGKPVTSKTHPAMFLANKIGRNVVLTINDKPTTEGARKITVKPIPSSGPANSESGLKYADWVESNRKLVEKLSGGRIGYAHVPDTSQSGLVGLMKGYYSQSDKEALIVDERFNGGGMIPTMFVEKLVRQTLTAFRQRAGADVGFPPQTVDGPKAMLINGYAGSGGDLFPWLFKANGVGPLIGKRTWGGLVGLAGSADLVDGGFLAAPEFGLYDVKTGKWIAENTGVDPDIDVDWRPDLLQAGRDPQIEKAVEYLLNELKKSPRQPYKRPEFPKVKLPG